MQMMQRVPGKTKGQPCLSSQTGDIIKVLSNIANNGSTETTCT